MCSTVVVPGSAQLGSLIQAFLLHIHNVNIGNAACFQRQQRTQSDTATAQNNSSLANARIAKLRCVQANTKGFHHCTFQRAYIIGEFIAHTGSMGAIIGKHTVFFLWNRHKLHVLAEIIAAVPGNFAKITELCKQARSAALGFEVAHVGVNCEDADASLAICKKIDEAFGLGIKKGNSSNFASSGIEVMKSMYLGKNGHIAIRTNSVPLAVAELEKNGFVCDLNTAKYKGERMTAVYLKDEIGGFAMHLLQK